MWIALVPNSFGHGCGAQMVRPEILNDRLRPPARHSELAKNL